MPTYQNVSNEYITFRNLWGGSDTASPGENFESYEVLYDDRVVKKSNIPSYNPIIDCIDDVSGSSPLEVPISLDTKSLEIYNGGVKIITAYINSVNNKPGFKIFPNTIRTIEGVGNMIENIVLEFIGTMAQGECIILGYEE